MTKECDAMITYKEHDFLSYMPDVAKYNRGLIALNDQWENEKLLCEINCPGQAKNILPSMVNIQSNFSALQDDLINALIFETLNKMEQKTISKAQVAVDILIRNLYERTADVGFLATDDDIRKFASLADRTEEDRQYISKRLKEYVAKYTVYEEIIILDKDFTVIANFDESNRILGARIDDRLLQETLDSNESFVESYRPSPLQAKKERAHIFSKKIMKENSAEAAGIICLCFRFDNEMSGIFKKLCSDYDGSVIMIIDKQNNVIASSDNNHVPVGIKVEAVDENKNAIVYYRGMEYIAKTVASKGYQGYYGLGWKGHIMIPLGLAFKDKSTNALKSLDPAILSGLMGKADSFSVKLHEIMVKTQKINHSLKRIVYNGQIVAKDANMNEEYVRLKPLLNNINKTGIEIGRTFEKSVKNLFATVISTSLREERSLASQCIDIMDRNLYERSDDCRWWALNPTFKAILSKKSVDGNDRNALTKILQYINSLYTVYSSLFLFDKTGKIVAVSDNEHNEDIGRTLANPYISGILKNNNEGKYFVSPFEASELYSGRYTYIYGASITDGSNNGNTVGGIGIVFDSEFQFKTMLENSLPSNGSSFAVYIDRSGKIISSTEKSLLPGDTLKLPKSFFELKNGASSSEIIIYDDCYYAVGYACSSGYREYKNSDGYHNDITALAFEKLADCASAEDLSSKDEFLDQSDVPVFSGKSKTLATFLVNGNLLALEQSTVLEVIEGTHITALPESSEAVKGVVAYNGGYVTVLDTHCLFGRPPKEVTFDNIIIMKLKNDILVGLVADQLNSVLEIGEDFIKPTPAINGSSSFISGVACFSKANNKYLLVIDEDKLIKQFDPEVLRIDVDKILPLIEEQCEN